MGRKNRHREMFLIEGPSKSVIMTSMSMFIDIDIIDSFVRRVIKQLDWQLEF